MGDGKVSQLSRNLIEKYPQTLYPDLIRAGGLTKALQSALTDVGSPLVVSSSAMFGGFPAYARVEAKPRFSQVYIAAEERLFLFDFWAHGVMLAKGQTANLSEMARAIDKWIGSSCSTDELRASFDCVTIDPNAQAYEQGNEVEEKWRFYLERGTRSELAAFVQAAYRHPQLNQLFPYKSMMVFCFSRCTGFPFTRDIPHVCPLQNGLYEVRKPSLTHLQADNVEACDILGVGDAATAVATVVAHLPLNCGPAVQGTAEDLDAKI